MNTNPTLASTRPSRALATLAVLVCGVATPTVAAAALPAAALARAAAAGRAAVHGVRAEAATATPTGTTPSGAPGQGTVPQSPAVSEHAKLEVLDTGGEPRFAIVGRQIVLRGVITSYASGQRVAVSFLRDRRRVGARVVHLVPRGDGTGRFQVRFTSHYAGTVQALLAVHLAAGSVLRASAPAVQYVHTELGPGSSGASVRLLQSELYHLHYAVPLNGVFEEGTARAVIAYRKVTDMERTEYAGMSVFSRLARHGGAFHVRYPHDGRHVEANLTKQVLAEIEPKGRVREIYMMSSGKPSTPTVVGRFSVYLKTPGTNEKGMVDSNYFISGYAIHGYPEVPTYAASHGCLRVPIPDAASIFSWVQVGTPVDVYDQTGGGSTHVRGNAGP
jgi:hypothetical protein